MSKFVITGLGKGTYNSTNPISTANILSLGGGGGGGGGSSYNSMTLTDLTTGTDTTPKVVDAKTLNDWLATGAHQDSEVRVINIDPTSLPANYTKDDVIAYLNTQNISKDETETLVVNIDDTSNILTLDWNNVTNKPSLSTSDWNLAYSWGNHASVGYLTYLPTHSHATLTRGGGLSGSNYNGASATTWAVVYGTTSGTAAQGNDSRINNGQTAFGWGNHASAGYLTSLPSHNHDTLYVNRTGDTITGKIEANASYRSAGLYGNYSSTKIGHVWSMGTAYSIPDTGANFGTLFGIAYKHTNNSTGGNMAGGHQIVFCSNGSPGVSIGLGGGIWSSGNIQAPDFVGTSDKNLKEDINIYEPKQIQSDYKTFKFIDDEKQQLRLGVIAQELEVKHPEFVRTSEDGIKSVSYQDLHSAEIAFLKSKIDAQEERILKLESMIEKLMNNGSTNG